MRNIAAGSVVMAGLVPAIHVFAWREKDVDHRDKPGDDGVGSNVGKARRALVDIGADRLELIGATHQFHLLDGFG